jgi:AcrR family transcriptional regulator
MDKKSEILKVFLDLIITNGFHATPMSLVAKTSNISIGTIYHYFRSKEKIIEELYSTLKEKFGNSLRVSDKTELSPRERFFLNCRNFYRYFIQNPSEFLFFEQYSNSPYISTKTKEENIKHYKFFLEYLEYGIESGFLRNMPIELMFWLIYGNLATIIKINIRKELEITDELLDKTIQSIWDGIKIN